MLAARAHPLAREERGSGRRAWLARLAKSRTAVIGAALVLVGLRLGADGLRNRPATGPDTPPYSISVSGQGKLTTRPDVAFVTLRNMRR